MKDTFLSNALMIFMKREIDKNIYIDTIIENFENLSNVEFLVINFSFVKNKHMMLN